MSQAYITEAGAIWGGLGVGAKIAACKETKGNKVLLPLLLPYVIRHYIAR